MDTVDYENTNDSMYDTKTFSSFPHVNFDDQLPNIDIDIFNLKDCYYIYNNPDFW